jgi:hypothetical protein
VLGQTTPHLPLYLVEAAVVELVALRFDGRRPITLGAVAGFLIGTVGFAAEYAYQALVSYNPWTPSLIAEGLICAVVAGTAGGVLGGWIGRSVVPDERTERVPRWAVPAAGAALVAAMVWAGPMPNGTPPRATVTLQPVASSPERMVMATVRLDPSDAAEGARWFTITAWQGGGAIVAPMKQIGEGVYRAARPVPVSGDRWKVTLRLQRGRAVLGLPVYMPEDQAIPVNGIPAPARFTRSFVRDKQLLLREQKAGVPGYLTLLAYLAVLAIWSTMIAVVCWALWRFARSAEPGRESTERFSRDEARQPLPT